LRRRRNEHDARAQHVTVFAAAPAGACEQELPLPIGKNDLM
jgi:hypothetical protein